MDARALARLLAAARVGLGLTMVVAPRVLGRLLVGRVAGGPARVLTRGFGARDVAIGAGMLRALRSGEPTLGWVAAGIAADLTDFAAAAAADDMPALGRAAMMAAGGGATVAGVLTAGALDGGAAVDRSAGGRR